MAVSGVVRIWHDDEGWGVIDSPDTPGGCWAHYSGLLVSGYRTLEAGQLVMLEYERADQDGYSFRATEVWPADQEPDRTAFETIQGPSDGYRSTLTMTFDDPDTKADRAERIQQELEAALQAFAEHERVRARLERARQEQEAAHAVTEGARQDLASEETDVRRLESYSPTRIWAALRGSRDADLDREQAERQAAEYAVARAQARLLGATDEVQRSEARLTELGDVTGRRERALAAKEEWLTSTADEAGAHLASLADELASTRSAANEVREAVAAAELAANRLALARKTLASAGDWATYDTFFGGGMFSDMVKYQRMDDAQRLLHAADQALRNLAVELADTGVGAVVNGLAVDGLTQTFDVWFDNIFSDWSVRSRITEAAKRAESTADVVHQIRVRLAQQERDLADQERALVADRERLLTGDGPGGG